MATVETFRPTLLIGVGGTGIKIAERINSAAQKTEQGRGGRISVLPFDFDVNDLRAHVDRRHRDGRPQLSTDATIEKLLDDNPGVEPAWFGPRNRLPPDILKMTLRDGAAQMRLLSRLGLHHAFTAGLRQSLGAAVRRLGLLDSQSEYTGELNIMMVGSVAGATGSGTFIQLALAVRDICMESGIKAPTLSGLFLLPDVFVHGAGLPSGQEPNVLANGYASLKELNAVNDMANGLGTDTAFTFEYTPGRFLQRNEAPPFKSIALVDFENLSGGSYGASQDAYLEVAARAAFMLIFTPVGLRTASMSVNSGLQRLAAAAQGRSNIYLGVAVSAVRYPAAELARYLTLQLAMQNLEGDWLRLDRAFSRSMEEFRNRKLRGDLSAVQPEHGAHFLEVLRTLARSDRIAFFREIDARLNPVVRDPKDGTEKPAPRHISYLEAILEQIRTRYWARSRLSDVAARRMVDVSQLPKIGVEETVRRLEYELDADLNEIDRTLESAPDDDFINLLVTADDLGEGNWREFHLQYYLVRGGPHLVEVRAFLYGLREAITAMRAGINPAKRRDLVMTAANRFDESRGDRPGTRGSPRIIEQARLTANRNWISGRIHGSFEGFQTEYADYHATSRIALREYADQSVAAKVLARLDQEAAGLLGYLEQLFSELGGVFSGLRREVEEEESRHDTGRKENDGNIWVYADREAKQSAWRALEKRTGGLRLDEDANKALSASIYKRYRDDERDGREHDFTALGKTFRTAVVDQFARSTVEASFRDGFDFSVIEAVKRDVEVARKDKDGRELKEWSDWRNYLRSLISLARSQSQPFLTLVDSRKGDQVLLWAVADSLREEIGDSSLYDDLFAREQGEGPVEGSFDNRDILCMHSRVNLELTDLAKFFPGEAERPSAPPEGRYARAYRQRVENLLEAELVTSGVSPHFTPHIDAIWHRPGVLPEIFPELNEKFRDDVGRGFVIAIAEGLIRFVEEYGNAVTNFSTVGRVTSEGLARAVTASHDILTVAEAFERKPELVRATLRCWADLMEAAKTRRDRAAERLANMQRPEVLVRFLGISVDRARADRRDALTKRFVEAWVKLMAELVAVAHSDLAQAGRDQGLRKLLADARQQAFTTLADDGVRKETLSILEQLFDGARAARAPGSI